MDPGCAEEAAPLAPCCAKHWRMVPIIEVNTYNEAMRNALASPNVQHARRAARNRIGAILRGVKT